MREEDLFEALGDVDPEMVKEADEYSGKHDRKKGGNRKLIAAAAVCAVAAAVVIGVFAQDGEGGDDFRGPGCPAFSVRPRDRTISPARAARRI